LAADAGHIFANNNVGSLFLEGRGGNLEGKGVPVNHELAFSIFKSAAEKGDADSQYMTGYMYGKGLGVERDLEKMLYWVGLLPNRNLPRQFSLWNDSRLLKMNSEAFNYLSAKLGRESSLASA
jgi:hypothetical protein